MPALLRFRDWFITPCRFCCLSRCLQVRVGAMEEETVWCHEVSPACQMLGIPSAPIHRARHQANPTRQGTPPWLQSQAGIHLFLYSDNQLVPRYCPQLEWMILFSLLCIMCFLTVLAILLHLHTSTLITFALFAKYGYWILSCAGNSLLKITCSG